MLKDLIKKLVNYENKELPDLGNLIKNLKFTKKLKSKKILIATSTGGLYSHLIIESILGTALKFKGAEVEFFLCDGALPACLMCTTVSISETELLKKGPKKICSSCFFDSNSYLKKANFNIHQMSNYLEASDYAKAKKISEKVEFNKIKNYKIGGVPVGMHAYAAALRYYGIIDLKIENNSHLVLKKYFESALITKFSLDKFFKINKYDLIIMNHGIYTPQGILNEMAIIKKIKIITWYPFYRKKTIGFSSGDTYHREYLNEKNSSWVNMDFNKKKNIIIKNYLNSRKTGKNDWIYFFNKINFDKKDFYKKYNINKKLPIIGLATNVIWDAQIDYPNKAFKNILDWVFLTIDFFRKNQNLQLIIRVHPAEINTDRPARQRIEEEIKNKFHSLPQNIIIIPAEDPISTYTVFEDCNSVLIYASKMGIELPALGIPVIVAGEGQIKNKKIAIDINSINEYKKILRKLPIDKNKYLNKEKIKRAKKYAYHFFFRKSFVIKSLEERVNKWPNVGIDKNFANNLVHDKDNGTNAICDAILNDKKLICYL